jgi:hypothetical protein
MMRYLLCILALPALLQAAPTNSFWNVSTSNLVVKAINLNGSNITDWSQIGTSGTDSNTVNALIAAGTSLNASNWLGWAGASNWLHTAFLSINGTSTVAQTALAGWPTQWAWSSITNAGAVVTNGGNATLGTVSANAGTFTTLTIPSGGTLTVNGVQNNVLNIYTTINNGTNYVNQTIYSTNISYTTYLVVTNQTVTNTVDTYVNIGGNFTVGNGASFWGTNASIYLPTLTITGTLAQATGTWDFTGATVNGLPFPSVFAGVGTTGVVYAPPGTPTNYVQSANGTWISAGTPGALTNETDPVWLADKPNYATTNITQTTPSGTGSLVYSNGQFYFTPPSAAGLGSVTNVYLNIEAGSGITVNGGASVVLTNNGTLTIAETTSTPWTNSIMLRTGSFRNATTNDFLGGIITGNETLDTASGASVALFNTVANAATNIYTGSAWFVFPWPAGNDMTTLQLGFRKSGTTATNFPLTLMYSNRLTQATASMVLTGQAPAADTTYWTNMSIASSICTQAVQGSEWILRWDASFGATTNTTPGYMGIAIQGTLFK